MPGVRLYYRSTFGRGRVNETGNHDPCDTTLLRSIISAVRHLVYIFDGLRLVFNCVYFFLNFFSFAFLMTRNFCVSKGTLKKKKNICFTAGKSKVLLRMNYRRKKFFRAIFKPQLHFEFYLRNRNLQLFFGRNRNLLLFLAPN